MKLDFKKIIIEDRAIESAEEDNFKNESSDDEESIVYSRRDSNESNTTNISSQTDDSTDSIEALTEKLNTTLTVDDGEKTDDKVDSLIDKLNSTLKVAEDDDFKERHPTQISPQVVANANHYSGGTFSQQNVFEQVNYVDYGIFNQSVPSTSRSSSSTPDIIAQGDTPHIELDDEDSLSIFHQNEGVNKVCTEIYMQKIDFSLCGLNGDDISDFFNSLAGTDPHLEPMTVPDSVENFSVRQSTPTHSFSSDYASSVFNSDIYSPRSNLSAETDNSHRSDSSILFNCPMTSELSLLSSYELPRTLPNSSDEEEQLTEASEELRIYIDNNLKEIKQHEWIVANNKEDTELKSDLQKILCADCKFTDRKLVKIYAIISALQKMSKYTLTDFFSRESDILLKVIRKNNLKLLKYIVEIMQNLNMRPENISDNSIVILKNTIRQPQDMRDMLKTILTLKTKNNKLLLDVNDIDSNCFTIIHDVLQIIGGAETIATRNMAASYLEILLHSNPDLEMKTIQNQRTYLHYAILWQCGSHIVKMILQACVNQNLFDLVNKTDINGDCALRMAACLTQDRKEVEDILLRYNAVNIYQ